MLILMPNEMKGALPLPATGCFPILEASLSLYLHMPFSAGSVLITPEPSFPNTPFLSAVSQVMRHPAALNKGHHCRGFLGFTYPLLKTRCVSHQPIVFCTQRDVQPFLLLYTRCFPCVLAAATFAPFLTRKITVAAATAGGRITRCCPKVNIGGQKEQE